MRKVKIPLDDLILVLEAMRDSGGTKDLLIFELNGLPAIADFAEQDNVITFAAEGDFVGEMDDDTGMH